MKTELRRAIIFEGREALVAEAAILQSVAAAFDSGHAVVVNKFTATYVRNLVVGRLNELGELLSKDTET